MRVFIDLGYDMRGVADIAPAELETFTKVLDRLRPCNYWYNDPEINLAEKDVVTYTIKVLPASIKLVTYAEQQAAEEN